MSESMEIGYDDGEGTIILVGPPKRITLRDGIFTLKYADVILERSGNIDRCRLRSGAYDSGWVAVDVSASSLKGATYEHSLTIDIRDKTPRPGPLRQRKRPWWRRILA